MLERSVLVEQRGDLSFCPLCYTKKRAINYGDLVKRNYGVWGLGVVGTSVLRFLHARGFSLSVMDARKPSDEERMWLESLGISYFHDSERDAFFNSHEYIVPSPGIALPPDLLTKHAFVEELDLFADAWKNKLIAVTGTVGKTSTVHLLSQILGHNGISLATGGNIGTGMLDLIGHDATYGLLELSSFQLERATRFVPDIALITNLYPNHLDRHGTFDQYFLAKYKILHSQQDHQQALLPLALKDRIRELTDRPLSFFSAGGTDKLGPEDTLYSLVENVIIKQKNGTSSSLIDFEKLPQLSYKENWLMIVAICDMLGISPSLLSFSDLTIPAHRLESLGTYRGIAFYNDSKSTIPQSSLAAVEALQPAPIHLMLGGLGKGVDRGAFIPAFKNKVQSITCFGAEADTLYEACKNSGVSAYRCYTLEEAFQSCLDRAQPGDRILFSPSGASYDFYKHYAHRGEVFKELVNELKEEAR